MTSTNFSAVDEVIRALENNKTFSLWLFKYDPYDRYNGHDSNLYDWIRCAKESNSFENALCTNRSIQAIHLQVPLSWFEYASAAARKSTRLYSSDIERFFRIVARRSYVNVLSVRVGTKFWDGAYPMYASVLHGMSRISEFNFVTDDPDNLEKIENCLGSGVSKHSGKARMGFFLPRECLLKQQNDEYKMPLPFFGFWCGNGTHNSSSKSMSYYCEWGSYNDTDTTFGSIKITSSGWGHCPQIQGLPNYTLNDLIDYSCRILARRRELSSAALALETLRVRMVLEFASTKINLDLPQTHEGLVFSYISKIFRINHLTIRGELSVRLREWNTCLGQTHIKSIIGYFPKMEAIQDLKLSLFPWSDRFCQALSFFFIHNQGIQRLDLCADRCNLTATDRILKSGRGSTLEELGIHLEEWNQICSGIARNESLSYFLTPILLGQEAMNMFQIFHSQKKQLETLRVREIVGPRGEKVTALIDIAKLKDISIQKISFSYTKFDMSLDEAKELLEALEGNYSFTLENYDRYDVKYIARKMCNFNVLGNTSEAEAIKFEILILFKLNMHGRRYLMEDKGKTTAGLQLLESLSNDLDCIFYHFKENSSLFIKPRHPNQKRKRDDSN